MNLLHQLLAPLLRQLGKAQAQAFSVVLGVNAQVRVLDGLFNGFQGRCVPGLNHQGPGVRRGDGGNLLNGRGGPVIIHGNAVQHGGVGPAGTHGGKIRRHGLDALFHLVLVNLVLLFLHNGHSFTIVPIFSPHTARMIFSGSFRANKSTGMWLSMDKDVAVESITVRCWASTSS
ncbi:hypothetical protein SDC9_113437 [bioreactor metagenome]|uniref:Uncharacterized protein n=1 Tax=bioreactor metagenome TaxID=1076179 RepID=A0A645BN27_9ZZZZ